MKKTISCLFIMVIMIVTVGLISCSDNYFDLVFMADGQEYERLKFSTTENISMPANPTKENYVFDGWYFDEDIWEKPFTVNALLDAPLEKEVKVYAKFLDSSKIHTVTFDFMNGEEVMVKNVYHNTYVVCPETPIKENYMFSGWYLYPDFSVPFDMATTKVCTDLTLYAKWMPKNNAILDYEEILNVTPNPKYEATYVDMDGNRYVIFLLGTRENVILNEVKAPTYYIIPGQTLGFDVGEVTEESLEKSFERSIGTSVGMSVGFETGVNCFIQATFSVEMSVTVDETVSEGYSKAIAASKSSSTSNSVSLDSCEINKYYAWAIIGTEDVYQYFVLNNMNEVTKTGLYSNIKTCETRIISSETSSFTYSDNAKLNAFEESDVRNLFGDGSEKNPYKIDCVESLKNIQYNTEACYKFEKDIDMQGTAFSLEKYSGVLDGNNHTISGLKIDSTSSFTGFTKFNDGTIKNLTIKDSSISGIVDNTGSLESVVGAFAGKNRGEIINCRLENSTIYGYAYKYDVNENVFVGGIAGYSENGTIKNCKVTDCEISGYSNIGKSDKDVLSEVGGIVGRLVGGRIESCQVTKNTISTKVRGGKTWTFTDFDTYGRVGGVAGALFNEGVITACEESDNSITETTVKAESSGQANHNKRGAIVGYISAGTVDSNNQYSSLSNSKG